VTDGDVGRSFAQLAAADRHRARPVTLAHRRVDATQARRRVARRAASGTGSGIGSDHVTGGVGRPLGGGEVVEGDVDSLAGTQRDQPRRVAGPATGVGRYDARQVAGLVGDDDRPQRVTQPPLGRYHCTTVQPIGTAVSLQTNTRKHISQLAPHHGGKTGGHSYNNDNNTN